MERLKPQESLEKANEGIEGAKSTIKDAMKGVRSEVEGRLEAAKDMFEELREQDMSEILENVQGFVRSYPIPTILGAMFIGYGIGRFLGGRSS